MVTREANVTREVKLSRGMLEEKCEENEERNQRIARKARPKLLATFDPPFSRSDSEPPNQRPNASALFVGWNSVAFISAVKIKVDLIQ